MEVICSAVSRFGWVVVLACLLGWCSAYGATGYSGGGGGGGSSFDGSLESSPTPLTLTGTTTASATHSIDGTGTTFLTEVNPGDLVYVTATTCATQFPTAISSSLMSMVWSVADNTHMAVSTAIGSGGSQTLCRVASPSAVTMVAPVGCGQQRTLRTDASASTTLDVCDSSEDCDTPSVLCTPSYALIVNDVVCLETDLATCTRVASIDDTNKQITVDAALGSYVSGTEVAIYVKRVAEVQTAFGTSCRGMAWQQKFPLLQSASGSAIQNNATENCWFESKRVQRAVGVLIADIADPPDLILARLGVTGAFPLHTLSAGDALPAGTSIAALRWMGWDGTALSQGAVDGAKTTELWTATAHGAKRRLGRVANTTTTTVFGIELDQDGTVYLGCEDGSGACEAVARSTCLKKGADGDASVCFKAPDGLAGTYTLEWPADDGTSGQLMSAGLGAGVMTWTSLAPTATALAANGTNCTAGEYARGVDASGNAENCTAAAGGGTVTGVTADAGGTTTGAVVTLAGATGVSTSRSGDTVTITGPTNVATATALAANGANCSAGQYPLGVNASGAVESCTAVPSVASFYVGTAASTTIVSGTTLYLGPTMAASSANEATVIAPIKPGTYTSMYCHLSTAPGGTSCDQTFILRKGACTGSTMSDVSDLTCTITQTSGFLSCNDSGSTVVSAGDCGDVKVTTTGTTCGTGKFLYCTLS